MEIEVESFEDALSALEAILSPVGLTDLQELIIRKSWEGLTYGQIAEYAGYDDDYIRDVGFHLWRRLSKSLNTKVSKSNFKTAIRRYTSRAIAPNSADRQPLSVPSQIVDWGTAVEIPIFYGRDHELASLNQWLKGDLCRILTILGAGGMGKSALALRFTQQIESQFDIILWRSVKTAPLLSDLIDNLLKQMLPTPDVVLPSILSSKLERLVQTLREKRCLIVLDNLDVLLASDHEYGNFQPHYAAYHDFLRQIGEIGHSSCIIITSREKPRVIDDLEREDFPVRTLALEGLDTVACRNVISHKGIVGSPSETQELIDYYRGHPLALKIVSASIQNLFEGSISLFLQQGCDAFNGLQQLLPQQLKRLSSLETAILNWLAIAQEPVTIAQLQNDLIPTPRASVLLKALENLKQRSLLETTCPDVSIQADTKKAIAITLQPAISDYLIEILIESITQEIADSQLECFLNYAIVKAIADDSIRDSQIRRLLDPISTLLLERFGTVRALETHLQTLLQHLQHLAPNRIGYGGGNLINLFRHLQSDLTAYNFSGLIVRQALLHDLNLRETDFSHATFENCTFANTFGSITNLAFSPDGNSFATCDSNGNVTLWSMQGMHPTAQCKGHDFWTWAVAFHPTQPLLASCGQDRTIRLWNTTNGLCLKVLQGHSSIVVDVAFHPNGSELVSCSNDGTIKQWDIHSGECIQSSKKHDKCVWNAIFSPDGQYLYSGGEDNCIRYWDYDTGACLKVFSGHTQWIMAIALSPDGLFLASASMDGTVKLWSTGSGEELKTLKGHLGPVVSVAFSPDGQILASGSYDQTVRIWSTRTGACTQILNKHTNRIWCVRFHPSGTLLASGGDDNSTRFWNLRKGEVVNTLQGYSNGIYALARHPQRPLLASAHEDQTLRLWHLISPDSQSPRLTSSEPVQTLRGHQNRILAVAFSSDGKYLASGSLDRTIKIWNPETGQCVATLYGHTSWIWDIAFHPHHNILASASYDRTVKLWDLETGICTHTLEGHEGSALCTSFSPNGQWLASGGYEKMLKLWSIPSGDCVRTWFAHDSRIWSVAFSPDSQWLATAGEDCQIILWNVETGHQHCVLNGHELPVLSVLFGTSGRHLFSSSADRTVKEWDLETGTCIRTYKQHERWVWGIVLDPSGTLLSGGQDESICCWDRATGSLLNRVEVPRPYAGMKIIGAKGLTDAQRQTLGVLGALTHSRQVFAAETDR
ncbi:MAG TPA: NB-ARC domain-containing protein [Stenomitos sp.]